MRSSHWIHGAAILALGAAGAPAFAQVADPAGGGVLNSADIVVTARKRAESLQDVPLSVTAVNADIIARNNIVKIDQVAAITPNVQLSNISVDPMSISAYIRGIGNRATEPSQDVPVAISIDGVYITDIAGSLIDVFDVQQIEILRGPQGTLQGRNSPGGAINVTTRRPSGDFGARFEAVYERFGALDLKGAVEAPLVQDRVAVKFSAFRSTGGGYVRNLTTGKDIGDADRYGGRIGILVTPNDDLTMYFTADYVRDRSEQAPLRPVPNAVPLGPRDPVPAVCAAYGYCTPYGKYQTGSEFTDRNSSKNGGLAANIDWDLGGVSLASVTGYRFVNNILNSDVDALPEPILHQQGRDETVRAISQEFRLSSNGDAPLQYVVGVYGIHSKFDLTQPTIIGSLALGFPPPAFGYYASSTRKQTTKSYAIFAQLSYDITDRWSISGGGRQSWDKKHLTAIPDLVNAPDAIFDDRISFSNLSLEAGTEYKFSRDINGYLRFSQGYRSGAFNGAASTIADLNSFRPEKVNSFEAGLKTELFDRRLTANIATFAYDYKDIQITVVDATPAGTALRIINGEGMKIRGVEFETHFRPTDTLKLSGSLGYLHAKYKSQIVDLGFGPTDLATVRKEQAPKLTAYAAFDYTLPVGGDSELLFSGDVSYRSSLSTTPIDNVIGNQSRYALVGAAMTLRLRDGKYTIGVFGRNLTDKYYHTAGEQGGGFFAFHAVGRPRTFGVRTSARF